MKEQQKTNKREGSGIGQRWYNRAIRWTICNFWAIFNLLFVIKWFIRIAWFILKNCLKDIPKFVQNKILSILVHSLDAQQEVLFPQIYGSRAGRKSIWIRASSLCNKTEYACYINLAADRTDIESRWASGRRRVGTSSRSVAASQPPLMAWLKLPSLAVRPFTPHFHSRIYDVRFSWWFSS